MKKTRWPGNWKVACHVCGFWYPSGEIKKRWDGLLVCEKDYETRHPQTLLKVRGEHAFPSFVSKDASPDEYVNICNIITSSPYVSLATVGCSTVGPYRFPYLFLYNMTTGNA
jgi:hypothetical protein